MVWWVGMRHDLLGQRLQRARCWGSEVRAMQIRVLRSCDSRFAGSRQRLPQWWQQLPVVTRATIWRGTLASLALLGLLLTFHYVVRHAVRQGELRRVAAAMHAETAWRCNALGTRQLRDGCLLQLNAVADDDPAAKARNVSSLATALQIAR
jgi:hypothetical protein